MDDRHGDLPPHDGADHGSGDELDRTLAELAEQGIEPERPPYQVVEGGLWICFVRDPDTKLTSVN